MNDDILGLSGYLQFVIPTKMRVLSKGKEYC